jgi:hypothetical protein
MTILHLDGSNALNDPTSLSASTIALPFPFANLAKLLLL